MLTVVTTGVPLGGVTLQMPGVGVVPLGVKSCVDVAFAPSVPRVTWSGPALVTSSTLLAVVLFRFSGKTENLDDKRAAARLEKLRTLQHESREKLSTYGWVNKDKGIVQLPIDRAEELVVAELKAKPVQVSPVKVENPYPAGLQQAVPAPVVSGTAVPAIPAATTPAQAATPAPAK